MAPPPVDDSLGRIRAAADALDRPVRLMEVCGTHTHAIGRGGLRALLPDTVELISGPGCPVCVTSQRDVERMIHLAATPGVTVATFGDMIRVPGLSGSLETARGAGADVRIVYSPLDALDLAVAQPDRPVVFIAIGFETTAPGVAAVLLQARERGLANFFVLASHKLVVPAMEAVLTGESLVDGFLTPGHVSVIIGSDAYEKLCRRYGVPCVATGFEPEDVLEGIAMLLEAMREGVAESRVQYRRAVSAQGNPKAWNVLTTVFDVSDAEWRGLGVIPGSGLTLREEFRGYDAAARFAVPDMEPVELPGCRCGDVLKGVLHPPECPMFRNGCTPRTPLGPCMVSTEGACAARYKYG